MITKLKRLEEIALGVAMLGAAVLLFINVMLRYFLHQSIFWAEEFLRYLVAWIIFIGIANCVSDRSHICVDILTTYTGPRIRHLIALFNDLVGIAFGVVFTYFSIQYVQICRVNGQLASTMGNIPMWCIYLCMPISCTLYALFSVGRLVRDIRHPQETELDGLAHEEQQEKGGEEQ